MMSFSSYSCHCQIAKAGFVDDLNSFEWFCVCVFIWLCGRPAQAKWSRCDKPEIDKSSV